MLFFGMFQPQDVHNVIANAFERLLAQLKHRLPTTLSQLRQLIIIFEVTLQQSNIKQTKENKERENERMRE
jgi:hypothetical protein